MVNHVISTHLRRCGAGAAGPAGAAGRNVASFGRKWRQVAQRHAECSWFRAEVATSRPAACRTSPVSGGSLAERRRFGAEVATSRPAACRTSPVSGGSGDMSPAALPNVAGSGRKWRQVAQRHAERRRFRAEVATSRPCLVYERPLGRAGPRGIPYASSNLEKRFVSQTSAYENLITRKPAAPKRDSLSRSSAKTSTVLRPPVISAFIYFSRPSSSPATKLPSDNFHR